MLGSPLLSHLGETLNGVSTIRAFRKEQDFIDKNIENLNAKLNITFWTEAMECWFQIRTIMICTLIFAFTGIFVVN